MLELKYGPGEWETSRFLLASHRERTGNAEVKRGERKLEFFVNAEWPRTYLEKSKPVFKEFEIEGDVSENRRKTAGRRTKMAKYNLFDGRAK